MSIELTKAQAVAIKHALEFQVRAFGMNTRDADLCMQALAVVQAELEEMNRPPEQKILSIKEGSGF